MYFAFLPRTLTETVSGKSEVSKSEFSSFVWVKTETLATQISDLLPLLRSQIRIQLASGNLLYNTIFLQSCRSYLVEVNQFN